MERPEKKGALPPIRRDGGGSKTRAISATIGGSPPNSCLQFRSCRSSSSQRAEAKTGMGIKHGQSAAKKGMKSESLRSSQEVNYRGRTSEGGKGVDDFKKSTESVDSKKVVQHRASVRADVMAQVSVEGFRSQKIVAGTQCCLT